MRWFGLVFLLALAACEEPRSAAYSPERGSSFEPVAVELQSAQLAQKIDGIATLVSPELPDAAQRRDPGCRNRFRLQPAVP